MYFQTLMNQSRCCLQSNSVVAEEQHHWSSSEISQLSYSRYLIRTTSVDECSQKWLSSVGRSGGVYADHGNEAEAGKCE